MTIGESGIPASTSAWTRSFNFLAEASTDGKTSGTIGEIWRLSYHTVDKLPALGVYGLETRKIISS